MTTIGRKPSLGRSYDLPVHARPSCIFALCRCLLKNRPARGLLDGYTPGGPHDAAIIIEAEGPEPINKFMSSVQSLGNVKMKFVRAFSIDEMRKML
jgi:hypothetical protein